MSEKSSRPYVRLTRKAVEKMFDECNERYFNNAVERPRRIETWTPHKKTLGLVRPMLNRRTGRISPALHVSRRFNWPEEELRNVVVHEMIHIFTCDYQRPLPLWQRIVSLFKHVASWDHDAEFVAIMEELNATYPELNIGVRCPRMKAYYKGPGKL